MEALQAEKKQLARCMQEMEAKCAEIEQTTKKNEEKRLAERIKELENDNANLRRKLDEQLRSDEKVCYIKKQCLIPILNGVGKFHVKRRNKKVSRAI